MSSDYNNNNNYNFHVLATSSVPSAVFNKQHFLYSWREKKPKDKCCYYLCFANEEIELERSDESPKVTVLVTGQTGMQMKN